MMVNTGWRDQWVRWSIQVGEIDGYDGSYMLERSMAQMVNTGWRDRWLRWSIQAEISMGTMDNTGWRDRWLQWSIQTGEIDG